MSAEWYAIELSEHGVCALPEDVARAVRSTVPGVEVFVPAYVVRSGSSSFVMDVYEGYIFVRRGDYDPNDLLQCTLLTRILMRGSGSKTTPVLLGTEAIEKMRSVLESVSDVRVGVGDLVEIVAGIHDRLYGVVLGVDVQRENASVRLTEIRSKEKIVTLPTRCLRILERAK